MRGDYTVDDPSSYVEIKLELDRIVFTPGQDIPVRYRVTNRGNRMIRIFPHEEMRRSFQFLVEDKTGHELPLSTRAGKAREIGEKAVRDLTGNSVKEILLHPGETFEKKIFLNDLYDLKPGEEYRVCAYFVPDSDAELALRSRGWSRIRMDMVRQAPMAEAEDSVGDPGFGLSPEETVYLFLSAELKHNWANYLKYVDLPRYIVSYDRFALQYAAASDLERPEIVRKFSTYLTSRSADALKRFKIMKTEYDRTREGDLEERGNARVTVQGDRESEGFRVRYEYIYTLAPAEERGFWKIVYVSARVVRQGQN